METILIRALQLMLSLSILVLVHEGGHFLFAKVFKIRVEKFSLFFDPWFRLFKFKPKNSETEYSLGWLPLGGYVKIAGMIDESMDKEQMKQPPKPWEFRSHPAYQRLLVMVGGVLFNFILAILIYAAILFTWGDSYTPVKNMKHGMEFSELAESYGFKDGDILLSADEVPFERMNIDLLRAIVDAKEVTVMRQGKEVTLYMPELSLLTITKDREDIFLSPLIPAQVDSVLPGSVGEKAGLRKGDRILTMNGVAVSSWNNFLLRMKRTRAKLQEETQPNYNLSLVVDRAGVNDTLQLSMDSTYVVGAAPKLFNYPKETKTFSFLEAIPAGVTLGVNTLKGYVSDMKYVFTKEGANSIGGFGTIASIFPPTWDWEAFWTMTAFLSIILAFMNILPIPALDGGHVLFLLYEIVTRRKPSEKFMEYAQVVGMILLFGLLLWANFNDVLKLF
jgi:regulator of sigma E protease